MKEKFKQFYQRILEYLIPYFVGIVAAMVFTPADLSLAGVSLWFLYPILAIPGFLVFFTQISFNHIGDTILGLLYIASVVGVVFGIVTHVGSIRRYRCLGPRLIGFLLGFVGTIAVFFISAGSI